MNENETPKDEGKSLIRQKENKDSQKARLDYAQRLQECRQLFSEFFDAEDPDDVKQAAGVSSLLDWLETMAPSFPVPHPTYIVQGWTAWQNRLGNSPNLTP